MKFQIYSSLYFIYSRHRYSDTTAHFTVGFSVGRYLLSSSSRYPESLSVFTVPFVINDSPQSLNFKHVKFRQSINGVWGGRIMHSLQLAFARAIPFLLLFIYRLFRLFRVACYFPEVEPAKGELQSVCTVSTFSSSIISLTFKTVNDSSKLIPFLFQYSVNS